MSMTDGNGNGVTDAGNGKKKDGNGTGDKSKIREWFLKTAATIIGGLGTAGAMVVIGSAVLWVRFKEAGIPAVQAVTVQPEHEALVQGAQTTIFFVLAALAVLALLYIVDFPKEEDKPDPGAARPIGKWTKCWLKVLPVAGLAWAIFCTDLGWLWVLGLLIVAVLLTAACLWIGHQASKNFWALAAVVFVSVIVFSGVAEYAIVQSQKYVQAVAILRGKEDTGLTGYYVAATEKEIYFANSIGVEGAVKPEGKPLQKVALNEDVTYSIGPLESQEDATARAPAMLRKLIADREGKLGHASRASESSLPSWVTSDKAATFGASIKARTKTPESLCLMRYAEAKGGTAKGEWWTSCEEAEAQASIEDARARFALPRRFHGDYDRRVRVEVRAGTEIRYVEGNTAPQCGGGLGEPCGYRYPGGGVQFWIKDPAKLGETTLECTMSLPDEESAWESCKE
jgi:hypothetical protein